MAEWLKAPVLKTGENFLAWVRIPPLPFVKWGLKSFFLFFFFTQTSLYAYMNVDKKIKLAKTFFSRELQIQFFKKIKVSSKPSVKCKLSIQSRVFFSFCQKRFYSNRFKNFCNLSSKPRAIIRGLKISSYSLKEKARKLQFTGVGRASW